MHDLEPQIVPRTVSDIGQYVRAVRKARGMTQRELCGICGVNRRFLSELENGKETAEIGRVLHVLRCMGCDVELKLR